MPDDSIRPKAPAQPDFRPPGLLRNRHIQSVMTQAPWRRGRARANATAMLDRAQTEILDCGDDVRLQGHLSRADNERGLVVLLHGWEGSADSSYVLSAGAALFGAGFSVYRLNLRDHGDTAGLNRELFHSCRIDEVVGAIRAITALHSSRRFAIVGQSLGGNFALRVAARAADAGIRLDRVIAICPVLQPRHTMQALDRGPWFYRRHFLNRWRRSLSAKAEAFPDYYEFGDLGRFETLTAMTAFFVDRYTEFDGLDRYLNGYALVGRALDSLACACRIVLASDDPIIPIADLEEISRPSGLQVDIAAFGGHCGFVDRIAGSSWIDREIVADLERLG